MIRSVRQANQALGPAGQLNNQAGINPLHAMIGAAVMNHLVKHAAAGSMPHAAALGRLMALHKMGMIGQQGQLFRPFVGGLPKPGGVQVGSLGSGY
jgi:hypothetical protein